MRKNAGYSIVEIMIAILFITIGFFGYVALHARLLHSGRKLEEKEVIRAGTDYFEALDVGRALIGLTTSVADDVFVQDDTFQGLHYLKTDVTIPGRDMTWQLSIPPEYHPGLERTIELSPSVLAEPYEYKWEKR